MEIQSNPLLSAFSHPEFYPHAVGQIQFIETHISWVVLTGEYAYKIKKPINLGFLDYSTLALREKYCREELRLNRRYAPELYLEVIAVHLSDQNPSDQQINLQGAGRTIEYAVKMSQFDPQQLLLNKLTSSEINISFFAQLAQEINNFHRHCEQSRTGEFGTGDKIWQAVEQNFKQIRAIKPEFDSKLAPIFDWTLQQHHKLRAAFAERKTSGFIRECHGDLHLGNIALVENKPLLFDGIEFNPNLRWIDTVSELAFLLMDLDASGANEYSARLLNSYLEESGDYQGLILLTYYKVYRAMVRAKVELLHCQQERGQQESSQQESSQLERKQGAEQIHQENFLNYIALAQRYTQTKTPQLFITHGVSGAGKTTIARLLADSLPAIHLRADIVRKQLHGLDNLASSRSLPGEGIYSAEANKKTFKTLQDLAKSSLRAGFNTIVDATFLHKAVRDQFAEIAKQLKLPFTIIDCEISAKEALKRVNARKNDASEATEQVLMRQLDSREPLSAEEIHQSIRIDSGKIINTDQLHNLNSMKKNTYPVS